MYFWHGNCFIKGEVYQDFGGRERHEKEIAEIT
jgi:hypothetical protein